MIHADTQALEAGLEEIRRSPIDDGSVRMIVRRPDIDQREVLETARLDPQEGLVGDTWSTRECPRSDDGSPHPDMQLNIMNSRAIALFAQSQDRWALAGDQLYLDLDLSSENLPPGTRLELGDAVIEVTDQPHTGCSKFRERYGPEALRMVNSPMGRALNLRGICARVIRGGTIQRGDRVSKLPGDARNSRPI